MVNNIIYKATSKTSKKMYIGQTTEKLSRRKGRHRSYAFNKNSISYNTHFSRAIRKYGFNDFVWKIICDNVTQNELNNLETKYIKIFDSFNNGYNSTTGGNHFKLRSDIIVRRNKSNMGRAMSKKTKEALRKANTGRVMSDEQKEKLSVANKGKKHTEETKKKMSLSRSGAKNHFYGKTFTTEHKEKLKKARKNIDTSGNKNPSAKLTWKIVREIRAKYKTEKCTSRSLAKEYNVGKSTILRVINNKAWKE